MGIIYIVLFWKGGLNISFTFILKKIACNKGRNGHIPFRDSKLTRILQSLLGGNARTAIIGTMSPDRSHVEQTRNTLLFASCAKEVLEHYATSIKMNNTTLRYITLPIILLLESLPKLQWSQVLEQRTQSEKWPPWCSTHYNKH